MNLQEHKMILNEHVCFSTSGQNIPEGVSILLMYTPYKEESSWYIMKNHTGMEITHCPYCGRPLKK